VSSDIKVFEAGRISKDPLDEVEVGKWYWVKQEDEEWNEKKNKKVKVGEHEDLMCVEEIGSNYVGFTRNSHNGWYNEKIHFKEFFSRCRPALNWKEHLQGESKRLQHLEKNS